MFSYEKRQRIYPKSKSLRSDSAIIFSSSYRKSYNETLSTTEQTSVKTNQQRIKELSGKKSSNQFQGVNRVGERVEKVQRVRGYIPTPRRAAGLPAFVYFGFRGAVWCGVSVG